MPSPRPCLQITQDRQFLHNFGVDTRYTAVFCENHDTDRFLALRSGFRRRATCGPLSVPAGGHSGCQTRGQHTGCRSRQAAEWQSLASWHACRNDMAAYRNALAFTLLSESIPGM